MSREQRIAQKCTAPRGCGGEGNPTSHGSLAGQSACLSAPEVLEAMINQFISGTFVIGCDDRLRADVGRWLIVTSKYRLGVNHPIKLLPTLAPSTELGPNPGVSRKSYLQLLAVFKNLLIKKPAVSYQDNRYILSVASTNESDDRMLCFALYPRMVRPIVRAVLHGGVPAFEDRRRRSSTFLPRQPKEMGGIQILRARGLLICLLSIRCELRLPERSIRDQLGKLGLSRIRESLLNLLLGSRKTPQDRSEHETASNRTADRHFSEETPISDRLRSGVP